MANFYFFIYQILNVLFQKKKQTRWGGGGGGEEGISRGIKERTCEISKGQLKKK